MSDYVPIPGYLYILHNPSFEEDTYKLGRAQDLDQRKNGYATPYVRNSEYLHTSSVLLDSVLAEKMLEEKLADVKVRKDREFYKCSLDRIKLCFSEIEEFFEKNDTIKKLQPYAKPISDTLDPENNVNSKYICKACNKAFTLKGNLTKHYSRCNITKYLNGNKINGIDENNDKTNLEAEIKNKNMKNEILKLKLNEATQLIKDKDKDYEILKLKSDLANQLIKDKDEQIAKLQQYVNLDIIQNNLTNTKFKTPIKITTKKVK